MKHFILSIFFISGLSSAELDWPNDYEKAVELAKQENKNIYIFIGADRCRFCDTLKNEALTKKSVIKRLNNSYIYIYLSRDRDNVPKQFSTSGVPRHYFVNPKGETFYENVGFREENGFHKMINEAEFMLD